MGLLWLLPGKYSYLSGEAKPLPDNNHIDMVDIGVVSGNSAMSAFFCLS